jgi:predicted O-linked N-acetylglucosamine transferase (SPINDLY family)
VVALPALKNGFVTFGCFNNLAKITPRVIETWCAILRRLPTARLILKTHQLSFAETANRFRADFAAHGIDAQRIEMRGSSGHRAFMGQYGDVDIVLDPFPYSGGLTTCESLWMGVPTIALSGEIFASRHSTSHLSNAGLADWVTASTEEYVQMAVARASDLHALAALRARLREQVRRSPLCDAPRFGRGLGAGLRLAWRAWCAENVPSDA